MNKALIDTDIFSEMIKGVNRTVVARAAAYRQAFARYTVSAVTLLDGPRLRGSIRRPSPR